MATKLEISELDFDGIKANLKKFFKFDLIPSKSNSDISSLVAILS